MVGVKNGNSQSLSLNFWGFHPLLHHSESFHFSSAEPPVHHSDSNVEENFPNAPDLVQLQ